MQPAFVYDLDFIPRDISLSRKSEIVCTMSTATFERLMPHILDLVVVNEDRINSYLPKKSWRFLQGEKGFVGYGACCRLEQQDGDVHLYFELRSATVRETVVTLVLLTYALRGCFTSSDVKKVEKPQLLDIATYFNPTPHGYCPEGRTFPAFGRWLVKQSEKQGWDSMLKVRESMMEAWQAVAPRAVRKYANDCSCSFSDDGRFALGCFGDACDMAIYPEGVIGSVAEYGARINSHNVESPYEQLTLVAGLAEMWGLARTDLEKE